MNVIENLVKTMRKIDGLKAQYQGHISLHTAAVLAGDKVRESEERARLHAVLDNLLDVTCEAAADLSKTKAP